MLAPNLIADAGEHTRLRFPDFFTAKSVAPVAAVRTHRVSAYTMAMPNNCCVNSTVIASEAKQSRGHSTRPLESSSQGLLAMTDGVIHVPEVDFLNSGRLLCRGSGPPLPRADRQAAPSRVHSPQVANMPTAAAAMTAVASQPRLFSHGLSVN